MRLLVQAVGPRVSHHYDRAWEAGEARATRLVVIGLKGLDRAADGATAGRLRRCTSSPTSSASLDDLIEPVDLVMQPAEMIALSFTDSDLAALSRAWKAADGACLRCGWRPCATCATRCRSTSGSMERRRAGEGRAGAPPRRLRLLALRLRPACGWRARNGIAACAAARRMSRADERLAAGSRLFPTSSMTPCWPASARAGRPISPWRWATWQGSPATRSRRRGRTSSQGWLLSAGRRCRYARAGHDTDGQARRPACCSTARCCWRTTSRRSTRLRVHLRPATSVLVPIFVASLRDDAARARSRRSAIVCPASAGHRHGFRHGR
jgi:hypothetical protein